MACLILSLLLVAATTVVAIQHFRAEAVSMDNLKGKLKPTDWTPNHWCDLKTQECCDTIQANTKWAIRAASHERPVQEKAGNKEAVAYCDEVIENGKKLHAIIMLAKAQLGGRIVGEMVYTDSAKALYTEMCQSLVALRMLTGTQHDVDELEARL
jgi:hypothetical protein